MSAIIDTLRATLSAAPDSWQCRLALVEALVAEDQPIEAAAVLETVTALPEDSESRVKAGRAYGLLDPTNGFYVIDRLLAEVPSFAPAHFERAELCLRIGDIESARRHYYTATTLAPDLSNSRIESGLAIRESEAEGSGAKAPALPSPQRKNGSEPGEDSNFGGETGSPAYPSPFAAPLMSIREALGLKPHRTLIDPESIPDLPVLAYDLHETRRMPIYTSEETYRNQLHSVELRPAFAETPITYKYSEPDDSIFEPRISDEQILAGPSAGEAVGNGAIVHADGLDEGLKEMQRAQAEAIARIERREKFQSLAVGIAVVIALCFLMLLVVTGIPRPQPPQIVAVIPKPRDDVNLQNEFLRRPALEKVAVSSPAAAMSMDIVSVRAFSPVATPTFDAPGFAPGMEGDATGFGMSMDFGSGGSGEMMFFGGKAKGDRVLFVLDDSRSMTPEMIKLRNKELEKTLNLMRNVQYHVLIFAGGAYFADDGWGIKGKNERGNAPTVFKSPKGEYSFKATGSFDFTLNGDPKDFPVPSWLQATSSNIRRSLKIVNEVKSYTGTDWDNALKLAHLMKPSPDVIFFMSDGRDGKLDTKEIIRNNKANGGAKINCVAMMIAEGVEAFSEIARRTGGAYTIVDKDGEPIDGFEYARNPKKFAGRL